MAVQNTCKKCGKTFISGKVEKLCPSCANGTPVRNICKKCGKTISPGETLCRDCQNPGPVRVSYENTCKKCGKTFISNRSEQVCPNCANTVIPADPNLPMKWHNFLVKYGLIIGAVLNVLTAFNSIMGTKYNGILEAGLLYSTFPALKGIDIVYGLAGLVVAAMQIYTRSCLAKFKKNAPTLIIATFAASAAFSLIYILLLCNIMGIFQLSNMAQAIGQLIATSVILVCNYIYYKKRKHLFVN